MMSNKINCKHSAPSQRCKNRLINTSREGLFSTQQEGHLLTLKGVEELQSFLSSLEKDFSSVDSPLEKWKVKLIATFFK